MSNIIFNKPIKYREICEMMEDEEKKGGKDRKYQLIKWQKKYEIEKNKTWYIIKREYSEREKFLISNSDKFTANIELILLNQIKNSGDTQTIMTYKDIFERLSMINSNYYKAKYKDFNLFLNQILYEHRKELCYYGSEEEKKDREKEVSKNMRKYFWRANNILKEIIHNSLESMQKRDLIIFSRAFRLIKTTNITNDKGELITIVEKRHNSTPEEDSKILGIIDRVKKEMGDKQLFFMTNVEKNKYYSRIDEIVNEELGYNHCHEAIRIIMSESALQRDLIKIDFISDAKMLLNIKTFNKMMTNSEINNLMPTKQVEIFSNEFIKNGNYDLGSH